MVLVNYAARGRIGRKSNGRLPVRSQDSSLLMAREQQNGNNGKLSRKSYEKRLRQLQTELCRLQDWVKHCGMRVIVVFEGRDGAGKGGTIRAITERVSPRVFRVV